MIFRSGPLENIDMVERTDKNKRNVLKLTVRSSDIRQMIP